MNAQAQVDRPRPTVVHVGVPPANAASPSVRDRAPPPPTGTRRQQILLVEDDQGIREALRGVLEDEQFAVTTADDGLEALRLLRGGATPDLIILDLRMPVMDGWRFRTEQKADPLLAGIPVLAISADGSPQAAAIDAAAYLRKPLTTDKLLSTVARVLSDAERKRLVHQLEEAERFAALGRLAASVGHEINNPLTCVSMNVDAATSELGRFLHARQDAGLHEALGGFMEMFHESRVCLDRIRDVVKDLQQLSRGPAVRRAKFSLNEVLEESLAIARNQVRHRATLHKRYGDLPATFGDRSAIGQVLLNLILNAAQSLPEGRADAHEIRLATWVDSGSDDVVVEVSDTGPGIPAHVLPHIFDPFFTTKPIGKGTGLGLAVSCRIVADHGGRIDVDSQPGRGSTFRMILPVTEPSEVPPAPTPAPAPRIELRARILVIDDVPAIGRTITVAMPDHDVTVATSARAAFARFAAGELFDLILCDLLMPELDGRDVLARAEVDWPHLVPRIVFMTGGAFTPESQAFLQRTKHHVMQKPFSIEELTAVVAAKMRGEDPGRSK